jgi:hypothetical protein
MSKALRIKIINYLRDNDAVAKYIDIRAHVLQGRDSVAERNEFKATLDYLSNKRLIAVNGSYEFLHWTVNYGLYNLDGKVIATKLTKAGQVYHPENESDDMEAFVPPVLAVIKKKGDTTKQPVAHQVLADTAIAVAPLTMEPEPLPWYVAPKEDEVPVAKVEPEPLPWYVAPKEDELPVAKVEPEPLPWYVAPKEDEVPVAKVEPEPLPWYVAPKEDEVREAKVETEPLPWYVAPKEEELPAAKVEPEPLPWYVAPKDDDTEAFDAEMLGDAPETKSDVLPEAKLPEHIEAIPTVPNEVLHKTLKALEEYEPLQPWYIENKEQKPEPVLLQPTLPEPILPEPVAKPAEEVVKLPWDVEAEASADADKQPVVYRFPPLDLKQEPVVKASPMVIERLNENLSHGIDAISNIKLKRPAALTGDFEKDTNVILKFVLIVVLFLLFGCIVWLYLG